MVNAEITTTDPAAPRTFRRAVLRHLSPTGLLGAAVVLCTVVAALLAPVIAPHAPSAQDITRRLQPPSWMGGPPRFFLGTDLLGRDVLSRVIFGVRVSMLVGVCAVLVSGTIGVLLGLAAGYFGGWVDAAVMRVGDVQLGIPFLVLAIALVAVVGPGLLNIIAVLGVTGWVMYGRIVRAEVLSVREKEFVEAARATGSPDYKIIHRHILPNVAASIIVVATLEVPRMIVAEASLSFLGLGVQPPTPTWGGMVADGRDYVATGWWLAAFPGLAVIVTVLGINLLGDWLRDVLDP
ncbi:MAG: ABC transporter permease, partial [Armatimonadetes bacterium]|nr:ABC transporter permease [Armatimonadota bacterium]